MATPKWESNLDFAQNRYYSSSHGRFTSVDPLMASAKTWNPQSFNRYVYVGNNPTNLTDPSGLCPPEDEVPCVDGKPVVGTVEIKIDENYAVDINVNGKSILPKTDDGRSLFGWVKDKGIDLYHGAKDVLGFDRGGMPDPVLTKPSPDAPTSGGPDSADGGNSGGLKSILAAAALALAQKYIDELINGKPLEDGDIYRLGRDRDQDMSPRPQDINGLSADRKEPSANKDWVKLDVKKLRAAGLLVVNDHGSHVAIAPKKGAELLYWILSRKLGTNNQYTQAVRNSIIEKNRK